MPRTESCRHGGVINGVLELRSLRVVGRPVLAFHARWSKHSLERMWGKPCGAMLGGTGVTLHCAFPCVLVDGKPSYLRSGLVL